jgi:KDO2-lipid IV(A) lauroyltransferase
MYYLLLAVLYPLSLLPLRILYLLSDVFYVIVYHITSYRRVLVMDNLRHAFPLKTEQELKIICKKFYSNFCDQWIETLKLVSMSKEQLNGRISANWEVFEQFYTEEQNVYGLLGHTFNWEWVNVACQHNAPQQFSGVYMPLTSQPLDRLMKYIRSRGGGWLISMTGKKSGFQRLNGVRYIVGLIADQNPSNLKSAVWLPFLNREAPFFKGPEQLATRAKAAVVFISIRKVKRGYYNAVIERVTDDASEMQSGELMKQYVLFMEKQIHEQPENWLWTHRRWKYNNADIV